MFRFLAATALTLAFLLMGEYARAQAPVCDPSTFKDYESDQSNFAETLAVLRIVDKQNFDSFKNSLGRKITLPIAGELVFLRR